MMSQYQQYRLHTLVAILIMMFVLSACGQPTHEFTAKVLEGDLVAYNLTGTDVDGETFQLSDHKGKYVVINFGYMFCPDICPLTLAELASFYTQLDADKASQVEVVFVSVDPERDTPEQLTLYMNAFHEDFHGLHIDTPEVLDLTKKAYSIYAEKRIVDGDEENYFVDHSGGFYVIDPEGQFELFFSHDTKADAIFADMNYLLGG
ncbi:MAG: SCO family protein [Chloroflexota bacterium]